MKIYAPYPDVVAVILLPEPSLRNRVNLLDTREYLVMMDKSVHSNVKRTSSESYGYDFILTREKAEELLQFIRQYSSYKWRWVDHHNVIHYGYCLTDPSEATVSIGPHLICSAEGYSSNEKITFNLELET